MNREQAKEKLKGKLKEYVESITEPDRRAGRNMYKCPLCGSGTGKNQTGAFSVTSDGLSWRCFSCDCGGDIFDLIGKKYNLPEFNDQLSRAAEFFNITIDTEYTGYTQKTERAQQVKREETKKADYSSYIEACKAAVSKTDYFKQRGFTDDTIERFCLGYDESKGVVVIPYNKSGSYYITRSVAGKAFRKPPADVAGQEPIYNKAALYSGKPCFICEAPIDALSIIQAGGNAVALGGTGSRKLIEAFKEKMPQGIIILSFDNDEPGRKATAALEPGLRGLNIKYLTANYSLEAYEGDKKDANDLLRANGVQFAEDITRMNEEAERLLHAEEIEAEEKQKGELIGNYFSEFKRLMTEQKPLILTGIAALDRALKGGLTDELYILGAETGQGKSVFTMNLAENIAARGNDVIYFALEMSKKELVARGVSRITKERQLKGSGNAYTAGDLLYYQYDGNNYSKLAFTSYESAASEYIQRYGDHLTIVEAGTNGLTADAIDAYVRNYKKAMKKTPIVFIDYLQMITPDVNDRGQVDRKNKIDYAVRKLKSLSIDLKTPVFTITSINRQAYGTRISPQSFKESGDLEYTGGILLGLNLAAMLDKQLASKKQDEAAAAINEAINPADGKRKMILEIMKFRNGEKNNDIPLNFYYKYNYFEYDDRGLKEWRDSRASGVKTI